MISAFRHVCCFSLANREVFPTKPLKGVIKRRRLEELEMKTFTNELATIAAKRVLTLNSAEPVARALTVIQEEHVRHLPVLRGREPVGMVTDHDVMKHVGWLRKLERRQHAPGERVEKIMSRPLISLSPHKPVEEGAKLLLQRRIGAIPIVDEGRLQGIVTKSDYLQFFAEENGLLSEEVRCSRVSDVMTTNVHCLGPDSNTLDAVRLLRQAQIRHIPVTQHGTLVGILSDRDVLRGTPAALEGAMSPASTPSPASTLSRASTQSPLQVSGLMTREVSTITSSNTLAEAAAIMGHERIGAVPVVDDGALVGILAESDLLRKLVRALSV